MLNDSSGVSGVSGGSVVDSDSADSGCSSGVGGECDCDSGDGGDSGGDSR